MFSKLLYWATKFQKTAFLWFICTQRQLPKDILSQIFKSTSIQGSLRVAVTLGKTKILPIVLGLKQLNYIENKNVNFWWKKPRKRQNFSRQALPKKAKNEESGVKKANLKTLNLTQSVISPRPFSTQKPHNVETQYTFLLFLSLEICNFIL